MKTKFLIAFLSVASPALMAQINTGDLLLWGGVCFDYSSATDEIQLPDESIIDQKDRESEYAIDIGGGYAYQNNRVVGLSVGYDLHIDRSEFVNTSSGGIQTNTLTTSGWYVAPRHRCYHPCGGDFAYMTDVKLPFGQTTITQENEFSDDPSLNSESELSSFFSAGVYARPTFVWFPNERWALEASLGSIGGNWQTYTDDNDLKHSRFNVMAKAMLFRPQLSFSYIIGANKATE